MYKVFMVSPDGVKYPLSEFENDYEAFQFCYNSNKWEFSGNLEIEEAEDENT